MAIVVEATIDSNGQLQLREPLTVSGPRRVLLEIRELDPPEAESQDLTRTAETPIVSAGWSTRYRLLRELGRGGTAVTYQAEDTHTGGTVCIKQLYEHVNRRALQQECRALARLTHPCVVRLLDFDTTGERPYIVVEYVEGTPLDRYMHDHGALAEATVLELALRIAGAVAYAHAHDVIHRDLKPGNIIIAKPEEQLLPKVVDFGLAVVAGRDDKDAVTAVGSAVGTPHYMAPEQFQGLELTAACDVYAVGQILWEMAVGRRAFTGPAYHIMREKLSTSTGLPVHDGVDMTHSFWQLVERCTVPSPHDRPSAREIGTEIEEMLRLRRVGP